MDGRGSEDERGAKGQYIHSMGNKEWTVAVGTIWLPLIWLVIGVPYGSRTRVAAVKGRCPRPLDERDADGELLSDAASRVTYRTSLPLSNTTRK